MGGANGRIAASVRVLPVRAMGYKGGWVLPGSRLARIMSPACAGSGFIWVLIVGLAPWAILCRPPARAGWLVSAWSISRPNALG